MGRSDALNEIIFTPQRSLTNLAQLVEEPFAALDKGTASAAFSRYQEDPLHRFAFVKCAERNVSRLKVCASFQRMPLAALCPELGSLEGKDLIAEVDEIVR